MQIKFHIHYQTAPGETIAIKDFSNHLTTSDNQLFKLSYFANGYWTGETTIDDAVNLLNYNYVLIKADGTIISEWGSPRALKINGNKSAFFVYDYWRAPSGAEKNLFSSAFHNVVMKSNSKAKGTTSRAKNTLVFKINVPRISEHHQVCVLGNQPALGNWNKEQPLLLSCGNNFPEWTGSIDYSNITFPLKYKYGIYNTQTKSFELIEGGADRKLLQLKIDEPSFTFVRADESFRYPNGDWKGAGVSVPVFSLRSEKGFGVGEFTDLIPFIDWAKSTGLKMVQILPVNETIAQKNWLDSYPYKSITVTALHPIYLNLEKMGTLKDKKVQAEFNAKRAELNQMEYVDYPTVMQYKSVYFQLLFDQDGKKVLKSKAFKDFFNANKEWLIPHAAFCYLRDRFQTADFREWGDFSVYDEKTILKISEPKSSEYPEIAKQYFIQFHLNQQLKEVATHARKNGVVLKGDIPIGISPNSVEAWTEPHLFNLNAQAGAPPDDFAAKGQNWGFPTYNWEAMEKEDFQWWKKRLEKMAEYFDAYRIDHILGFLRIWEIPIHAVEGILGYFNKALPLTLHEIRAHGIQLDPDRMTQPLINISLINSIFGDHAETVVKQFLKPIGKSKKDFQFKPAFDTQKKINAHFLADIEEEDLTEENRKIRNGLFDLIANVLFIKTDTDEWHPRISMQKTASYAALDHQTKSNLEKLYNEFFYKRHNDFWYQEGMKKLPAIMTASNMLVCGEDLGMVPDCVPFLMDELDILTLEIQRMSKNPKTRFADPATAPYLSVCTTSTHDMATIRGWWEEDRELIQDFFNHELSNHGAAPFFAEPWVCQQMIIQHLHSQAMWTTFPIQDLMAMDADLRWDNTAEEKINEPSNVRHHWRYRMKQSIEGLKNAEGFNGLLKRYVEESGRTRAY